MFSGAIDPVFPELSSHHYWWIQAVCNEFYPLKLQKPLRLIMPQFLRPCFIPNGSAALRIAPRGRAEGRLSPWSSQGVLIEASVSRFDVENDLHWEPSLNRLLLLAAEWYRVLQSELLQENDEHVAKAPPEVRLSPQKLNNKADRLADGSSPYSTIVNNTSAASTIAKHGWLGNPWIN